MRKPDLQGSTLIEVIGIVTDAVEGQSWPEPVAEDDLSAMHRWQQRLLPYMVGAIIVVAAFFLVASLIQLAYLQWSIIHSPPLAVNVDLLTHATSQSPADLRATAQLQIASNLEAYILQRRYHQANVLLMSRVWVDYLGFVTGMSLVTVGAFFVLGKLSEAQSTVNAKTSWLEFAVNSGSPGLVLVVLGTALMMTSMIVNHTITVTDRSTYVPSVFSEPATTQEASAPFLSAPAEDGQTNEPTQADQPSE